MCAVQCIRCCSIQHHCSAYDTGDTPNTCQQSSGSIQLFVVAPQVVQEQSLEDPLYVLDLGAVVRLYQAWVHLMPRVHPFYAVKCNTDPAMVSLLAALGAGFDCASEWEADTVLGLGVPAERIVFANACKRPCDIRFAAAKGLHLTTFDTESELRKLARWHPSTEALLRIRADDPQVCACVRAGVCACVRFACVRARARVIIKSKAIVVTTYRHQQNLCWKL